MQPTKHRLAIARRALLVVAASLAATMAMPAAAEADYPNRPIRLVIPFAPGGETDIFARAISGRLGEVLGQSVVVENRPGATGIVASELVARSAPDGYTLIFGTAATHALNMSVFKSLPYHPLKDFEPVAFVGSVPLVLFTHPSMPEKLGDFTAMLKANPGKFSYGAAGASTSHLGIELYKNVAAVNAVHVPYKGTGPALQDLAAGQVQFAGASIGAGAPLLKAGKLRAIAVMGVNRLAAAPDVPTFAEAGLPNLEVGTWNVVMAPAGTPKPIVEKLNRAVNTVLGEAGIQKRLTELGITPIAESSPESTARRITSEIDKWAKAFELSGAQKQ
ncbi:tripartite tricarboxylate transporter substrate binding protein [Burkholderiaceae bacterium FT117]|uniref:Bug family tripartite tricarboxylate transporter substrate binding protein n=1 Tax=Zeimonas sediminis TaxID=2944268 RepID=UPI002342E5C0|nr:tripartite tricarboxylate transporter substrate binding protein [Zeimonas sediminis]MCM5571759.1 tripartite tricarboxylate transporter substrate binding protein [Zeimonas sediminis]